VRRRELPQGRPEWSAPLRSACRWLDAGTTADRALQAAQAGEDPLTLAEARRSIATVLRRAGRPAQARDLLLEVAAYTAAVDGNRHAAADYLGEAAATATRLGSNVAWPSWKTCSARR
jgi:hypothetical protein